MGGFMSGRYPRGSRPKSKCVREFSLILDAPVLVKNHLIHGDQRRIRDLGLVCGGQYSHLIRGKIDVECQDTLPLHQQTGTRHRMELGVAELEYRFRGRDPIRYDIVLIAGLTQLDIVHWGFQCYQCHRYARRLFLPASRRLFLCRDCHNLRYISQDKLDKISRGVGDEWNREARLLGIPSPRFWEAMARAGRSIYRMALPCWVDEPPIP
jgi:hypothetical protein